MSSKIEQTIDEIEEFIDNCEYKKFSNTKILVNRDELEDLLAELRRRTPDEIKKYQKVLSNRERILADAQERAEAIIAEAQVQTNELLSEHQIMQQAYAQADEVVEFATNQAREILDNAHADANNIRMGAIQYTDGLLKEIGDILASAMETTQARADNLLHALQDCYNQMEANRRSLSGDMFGDSTDNFQEQEPQENQEAAPELPIAD